MTDWDGVVECQREVGTATGLAERELGRLRKMVLPLLFFNFSVGSSAVNENLRKLEDVGSWTKVAIRTQEVAGGLTWLKPYCLHHRGSNLDCSLVCLTCGRGSCIESVWGRP